MNTMIQLYAGFKETLEKQSMGFRMSAWDRKLLKYGEMFERNMMDLGVNVPLEQALDDGWRILAECFEPEETGIPTQMIGKFWPRSEVGSQKSEVRSQVAEISLGTNAAVAIASTNATALPPVSLGGYVPDDKYKLRVGDRISLQILEDRDAPKSLVVADSGELDVPYVGRVAASDKTCKQLADDLKTRLEKEYYHRATVVIALDQANKLLGRVYVWGQVRQQGGIDLTVNENLTAGKAILRAGGFGDFANKKRVKLVRSGGTDGAGKQTFELNMVEILEKGNTERDVVLQPDDFIIVPSRLINF
jgi:protein involved in polysaccharide export with SLBB domain